MSVLDNYVIPISIEIHCLLEVSGKVSSQTSAFDIVRSTRVSQTFTR